MRLIDANKCFDAIVKWAADEECTPIAEGACKAAEIIASCPTVDVFKWHNLRDNPNDLPKEDGYYLCIFEDDDTPYYTAFSENSFGDWHHDVHCELASRPVESYFMPFDDETVVIAWTRVPHFEGKMEVSE